MYTTDAEQMQMQFIDPFNRLCACYVPRTRLGPESTAVNKTYKSFSFLSADKDTEQAGKY